MADQQYSLFYPKSKRGLLFDYPEFRKMKEFKNLNASEMLFVWFYACELSPFKKIENTRELIKECLDNSFGRKMTQHDRERYLSGGYPDKIGQAIERMAKFKAGVRIRGKKLVEKILDNYEKIINIDVSEEDKYFRNKDGDIDWAKKKAYIDAGATVSRNLPVLMAQAEGGFGITEIEENEDGSISFGDGSLIDDFHEQKDD